MPRYTMVRRGKFPLPQPPHQPLIDIKSVFSNKSAKLAALLALFGRELLAFEREPLAIKIPRRKGTQGGVKHFTSPTMVI